MVRLVFTKNPKERVFVPNKESTIEKHDYAICCGCNKKLVKEPAFRRYGRHDIHYCICCAMEVLKREIYFHNKSIKRIEKQVDTVIKICPAKFVMEHL